MTELRIPAVRDPLRGTAPIDVTVSDGMIVAVEASTATDTDRVILPAFVDLHTHLREPGGEDAETVATGARAAAAGGYADVFAMPNTRPVIDTVERVEDLRARAADAAVRVHPVAAVTLGQAGRELVDVEALLAAGVSLFSDDGHCVDDEGIARELLHRLRGTGARFAEHCQSSTLAGRGIVNDRIADAAGAPGWPAAGEEVVVERDIRLAAETGGAVHLCHLSTRGSVELVRAAKREGIPVTAEVTPHHLMLSDEDALRRGPALKVNPPLRTRHDVEALRAALLEGVIDAVGTDHAPHPRYRKEASWSEAAFGLTALETALSVVARALAETTGGPVPWERVVDVMTHAPARIGGLPARPAIVPGAPADLCVVRTGVPWRIRADAHLSRSRNSPFDGVTVTERVESTFVAGIPAFDLASGSDPSRHSARKALP